MLYTSSLCLHVYSPSSAEPTVRKMSVPPNGVREREGVRGSLPMLHWICNSSVESGNSHSSSNDMAPSITVLVALIGKSVERERVGEGGRGGGNTTDASYQDGDRMTDRS